MAWFTQDAIDFFAELEQNNDREWFEKNRKRYENSVKNPMKAFASEMIARMRELDPLIVKEPKDVVFRIHRDTRFSKEKAPYKTNAGMIISRAKKGDHAFPGLYFHLQSDSAGIASGCYVPEPPQLQSIRRHIMENGEEFARLLEDPDFKAKFGEMQGAKNKILPAEFKEAAVTQPLLFNKQFFFWAHHGPEMVLREDLPEYVMDYMRAAWPMNEFLIKAIS